MNTFIIAEAGVNHNGSMELAKELIDCAADAGADAVKFQTFKAETLVSANAPKADYQIRNTGDNSSQFEMLKKLELKEKDHFLLIDHCEKRKIQFLSTAFDLGSLKFLTDTVKLKIVKISSGDLTNAPLLLQVAKNQQSVILSTGMGTLAEIEDALSVLAFGYISSVDQPTELLLKDAFQSKEAQKLLREKVTLLHCTTEYPAPFDEINLRAMTLLKDRFGIQTGYSDHTVGIAIPVAAVAMGACMIEKHFTTDRNLPGPDHLASLEPSELKAMVASIRQVELAMGKAEKSPTNSERKNMSIARKSLVASAIIKKGAQFNSENLTCKRPGNGTSPMRYWDLLGKKASKDYQPDDVLHE